MPGCIIRHARSMKPLARTVAARFFTLHAMMNRWFKVSRKTSCHRCSVRLYIWVTAVKRFTSAHRTEVRSFSALVSSTTERVSKFNTIFQKQPVRCWKPSRCGKIERWKRSHRCAKPKRSTVLVDHLYTRYYSAVIAAARPQDHLQIHITKSLAPFAWEEKNEKTAPCLFQGDNCFLERRHIYDTYSTRTHAVILLYCCTEGMVTCYSSRCVLTTPMFRKLYRPESTYFVYWKTAVAVPPHVQSSCQRYTAVYISWSTIMPLLIPGTSIK